MFCDVGTYVHVRCDIVTEQLNTCSLRHHWNIQYVCFLSFQDLLTVFYVILCLGYNFVIICNHSRVTHISTEIPQCSI